MSPSPPASPRPLLKVERLVAQTEESIVLLVTSPEGERLAVKQVSLSGAASRPGEISALVARVMQLMTDLRHPQLVEWRYYTQDADRARIVRVFQDGVTLKEFVEAPQTALPLTETVGWMKQMVELVAWFHEKGIIMPRGDLKPSHFILDEWEKVRLLDLDLVSLAGGSSVPGARSISACQPWVAPEIAVGGQGRAADVRSDVYSLGAVFHALLTRTLPPDSSKLARGEETLVPPHRLLTTVPVVLGELVESMMALNPDERPPDLREVAKALRNASRNVRRDGSSQQSHMRRCPQCRLRIARTAASCLYCALPPPTVRAITMGALGAAEKPASPPPSAKWRGSTPLVVGGIVLLGLVALLAWWFARADAPESSNGRPHRPGVKRSGAPATGDPSRRDAPRAPAGRHSPTAR